MIVNEKTAIVGRDVVLVPYRCGGSCKYLAQRQHRNDHPQLLGRSEHFETYHGWMQSPELRELTASEPLTLEEEHQMQVKWQTDADKLTFIILARPHLSARATIEGDGDMTPSQEEMSTFPMVGDVNLFLKGSPEGVEEVEAEVMVAEVAYRRKGVASSALHMLFHYATSPDGPSSLRITPERLIVRIGEGNSASLRFFEELSFRPARRVPVFQEVEMRYMGDGNWTPGKCIQLD